MSRAIHTIHAKRDVEMVLEHLGRHQGANVESVHPRLFDDTLTILIVQAHHIGGLLSASADGKVMVVAHTCAQHLFLPVDICALVIAESQSIGFGISAQIIGTCHIHSLGHMVKRRIAIIGDAGPLLAFAAFLCVDDDNAVGSFRTVDGRSGSIAKHVDALDVVGRHHRDVHTGDAVDDIVRLHGFTGTQGGGTTQRDARRAIRVTRGGHHQTGHLALKQRGGIGIDTLVQILGIHGGDRGGDVLAAHGAVAHDDDFVEHLVVVLQNYALARRDHTVLIAYVGNLQLGARLLSGDGVAAVDVGHRAIGGTLLHDGHADERLTIAVGDDTRLLALGHGHSATKQKRGGKHGFLHALL